MKTQLLNEFITRYNLASGEITIAKWTVDAKGKLIVRFTTADESCVGYVELSTTNFPEGEYYIPTTSTFKSLLSVLDEDITVKTESRGTSKLPTALLITDGSNKITYALGDDRHNTKRQRAADVKIPDELITLAFPLTPKFVNSFLRAKSALKDVDVFTIWSDTVQTELIIGYEKRVNTNSATIVPEQVRVKAPVAHISFDGRYLYDILNAIKPSEKAPITGELQIIDDGTSSVLRVMYTNPDGQAKYFINRKDVD